MFDYLSFLLGVAALGAATISVCFAILAIFLSKTKNPYQKDDEDAAFYMRNIISRDFINASTYGILLPPVMALTLYII